MSSIQEVPVPFAISEDILPHKPKKNIHWGELSIFITAAAIFVISLMLYVNNVSFRRFLPGWTEEVAGEKVGVLSLKEGNFKRKQTGLIEFQDTKMGADLYNYDTVITSPDGAAQLTLNDGSKIDLGPATMIKLVFNSQIGFGGISRIAEVQVVTGQVAGSAKNSKILIKSGTQVLEIQKNTKNTVKSSPVVFKKPVSKIKANPLAWTQASAFSDKKTADTRKETLELIYPTLGTSLRVRDGSRVPEVPVEFRIKTSTGGGVHDFILKHTSNTGEETEVIQRQIVSEKGEGKFIYRLTAPGKYTWEVMSARKDGFSTPTQMQSQFTVESDFIGVEPLPVLIAGKPVDSNLFQGDMIEAGELTLRWKAIALADKYTVKIYEGADASKLFSSKEVSDPQFGVPMKDVIGKKMSFEVSSALPNGFRVIMKKLPIQFNFLPPVLTVPSKEAVMSLARISQENGTMLLTWQKTNFTESYEIEIARDPLFKQIEGKKTVPDHLWMWKPTKPGNYWWRVRSVSSGKGVSANSEIHHFTLSP